ncbi:T-cell surface glycoprotein CD5 [Labeo rohita]|uniref:T-cell surface glycoprotein CD5 n=1 Tax=Labeo rohita TaxID=84645 RepID=A0ABQ8MZP8_LABRO|nr:T-cell surface glycoprotein CD5 [Labeo rohita]KAI2668319.1 T-cell surface glycoprotein CD5 [Labeo rohita]
MENSLLMILTALLLCGVQGIASLNDTNLTTPATPECPNSIISTTQPTPCPITIQNITFAFPLMVTWMSPCEGQLYVHSHEGQWQLCSNNHMPRNWWTAVCKERRCGDYSGHTIASKQADGYTIYKNNTFIKTTDCMGMVIMCKDPLGTELAAYKAVTGILIFLILAVILIQFGRPTYKAIRKRFSQKRQSRWVGPTQSVCYNRGQGPQNKNTEKRQSFPGLERLTVNQSREPSSNRNSDYDSYGYS